MPSGPGTMEEGVVFGIAFNFGGILLVGGASMHFKNLGVLTAYGLLQFLWMVPAWALFRSRGKTETAKGILVIAGLTAMACAACWVTFLI